MPKNNPNERVVVTSAAIRTARDKAAMRKIARAVLSIAKQRVEEQKAGNDKAERHSDAQA